MVEINWTIITYFVVGLFVLSGFFKGWWREAITTVLLGILVFLLRFPNITQLIVGAINDVINTILNWLPATVQNFIVSFFGLSNINNIRIDAGSGQTWLVVLILFLGLSILLSRNLLPNRIMRSGSYITYPVTPLGAILGGVLGGLNGFLIINLVREYLSGVNLPSSSASEVASIAGTTAGLASAGVDFLVTDLPGFTRLDTVVGWILIGFGLLVTLLMVKNFKSPPGYEKIRVERKKPPSSTTPPPPPPVVVPPGSIAIPATITTITTTPTGTTTTTTRWWFFSRRWWFF